MKNIFNLILLMSVGLCTCGCLEQSKQSEELKLGYGDAQREWSKKVQSENDFDGN